MAAPLTAIFTAKIVEWDRQRGFGFLQVGKQRVFLHHRDFAEHHKRPAVGDAVCFTMGKDAKGRACATNAVHENDGGRITVWNVLMTLVLLVLPAIALLRRGADFRLVGMCALVMSAVTYLVYALDKQRAREKEWRVSEGLLHLLGMLGGWPGAFLAQRRLRHKCSKPEFQILFWLIVLAYQFAAFDSLQNWKYSRAALSHLERTPEHRR